VLKTKACSCGSDAYVTYWAEKGLNWCHKCKSPAGIAPIAAAVKKKPKIDRMPDKVEDLTARKWNKVRPWKNIPFSCADKFGFYLAALHGRVRQEKDSFVNYDGMYLIMPIFRGGEAVSFSARLLAGGDHSPKYVIPTNVQKSYWLSKEPLKAKTVFVCEGIADAAYLSEIGDSVALLGVNYDGSLDDALRSKSVIIALDGDTIGAVQGMKLAYSLSDRGCKGVRILPLAPGTDPTDYSHDALKKLLSTK